MPVVLVGDDDVVTRAAIDVVDADACIDQVLAVLSPELVVILAAEQGVVALAAGHEVIALAAVDQVIEKLAFDVIVAGRAEKELLGVVAERIGLRLIMRQIDRVVPDKRIVVRGGIHLVLVHKGEIDGVVLVVEQRLWLRRRNGDHTSRISRGITLENAFTIARHNSTFC
jgi:hypothetical protein